MAKRYFIMNYRHPVWCNIEYVSSSRYKAIRHDACTVTYTWWQAHIIVWGLKLFFPLWRDQKYKITPLRKDRWTVL